MKRKIIKEILNFFPFSIFSKIFDEKCSKEKYNLKIYNYLKNSSFQYNRSIVNMIMKKNPNQIILLEKEIFLPIYAVFATGITEVFYYLYFSAEQSFNNLFYVNDYLFRVRNALFRTYAVIGGMYYCIEAEKYYRFLEKFKLPDEKIKNDYIQRYMRKLSKILEANNITFTDFEYYTFYQNTACFDESEKERKKKVKLNGIGKEYLDFYQQNPYYEINMNHTIDRFLEASGVTERFVEEKSNLSFVIKKFRFFLIQKDITFTIYCIKNKGNIEKLHKECLTTKKVPELTHKQDELTVTEFYSKDCNNIEPVLTFTSLTEMDYYEYNLRHFRFGKYILISYQKIEDEDELPKIYSYGTLLNV